MTPTSTSSDTAHPRRVQVYGNDHSPWVQAVLLGLHERGVDTTLMLAPPLSVFVRSGILMPVARFDDGPYTLDSERILVALSFAPVSKADRLALQAFFGAAAMRRTDDAWAFWNRFSQVADGDPRLPLRLWHQFWRAFSIFYFFVIIRFGRRRIERASRKTIIGLLALWQDRLVPDVPFLAGDAPGTLDLQLFGLVQMCASIPGTSFEVIRSDPKLDGLRAWISAMHERFATYDHLYTATQFEPAAQQIVRASWLERGAYWVGAVTMWLGFPITLPLVLFFVVRIRRAGLLRDEAAKTRAAREL